MRTWSSRVFVAAAAALTAAALRSDVRALRRESLPAVQTPAGQRPGTSSSQAPQAPAAVSGRVVDAVTGEPVAGAMVRIGFPLSFIDQDGTLNSSLTTYSNNEHYVQADGEGRFIFNGLPPNTYVLAMISHGYLASAFGQQQPNGPWRDLVLTAGQQLTNLVVKAWKFGAITGLVLDEANEPAVGVQVSALRLSWSGEGRTLTYSASALTDDRGVYRLWSLIPGDYLVAIRSATLTMPSATVRAFLDLMAKGDPAARAMARDQLVATGAPIIAPAVAISEDLLVLPAQGEPGLPPAGAADGSAVYAPAFYPQAGDVSGASTISIRSGDERSGVDLRLKVVQTFSVSGTVVGLDASLPSVRVALTAAGGDSSQPSDDFEIASTMTTPEGRFALLGVPEGRYRLRVLKVAAATRSMLDNVSQTTVQVGGERRGMEFVTPMSPQAPQGRTLWADIGLTVGGRSVDGLAVSLASGGRISGRIEFVGQTAPPKPSSNSDELTVHVNAADGHPMTQFTAAHPGADYQFTTMQYPPGRYFLSVAPVFGRKWFLRSFIVNGHDALRTAIDFTGVDLSGAVATFGDTETTLAGTVRADEAGMGRPVPESSVVLFPPDVAAWMAGGASGRLVRIVTVAASGTFRFPDLLPGDYAAAAVPAEAGLALNDPRVLAALARLATPVSLGAGENKSISLTLVTPR